MPVLWITIILSLLLALVFLVLFIKEHGRFHFGSPERASLLPLDDDAPPTAGVRSRAASERGGGEAPAELPVKGGPPVFSPPSPAGRRQCAMPRATPGPSRAATEMPAPVDSPSPPDTTDSSESRPATHDR